MTIVDLNFTAIAPVMTLATAALIVLILDLALPAKLSRPWGYGASLGGIVLALWYIVSLWAGTNGAGGLSEGFDVTAFGGAYVADRFSLLFGVIVLVAALSAVLLSVFNDRERTSGFLALVLWAATGMIVLASGGNFFTMFLGLELLSLSLYVLVAFRDRDSRSKEAGFKYLILGSVASAIMLYGFAFVYGQTGSVYLANVAAGWSAPSATLMNVGIGLIMLGFAFKLALVPFHMWAPDVYEGAPAAVTAFMTVGTRAAAFAALVRFLVAIVPAGGEHLLVPLWVLAGLSMIVGSIAACVQKNMKRILAYSGIAHAGYLSIALIGLTDRGVAAGIFYLAAYLFMNIGAFAIVIWIGRRDAEGETLDDIAGLFHRRPWLAASMTVFMLSLIGFPTTAGFSGKLVLATSALSSGVGSVAFWLVGILALTSAVSAYAYLRIVMAMFARPTEQLRDERLPVTEVAASVEDERESLHEEQSIGTSWALGAVIVLCLVGTLYLGLVPKTILALTSYVLPVV